MKSTAAALTDWLLAPAIYLALALAFFYPGLEVFDTALIGPSEDNTKYLWNIWWGGKALAEAGTSFNFSPYLLFPEGAELYYNDYSWYNLFLIQGLKNWVTTTAAYNVMILQSFVVAGWGAYFLVKYLIHHRPAALVAGYIFAFNPSHFAHALHHINISSIQFIPLFVLFYIRAARGGKAAWALSALFFLLASAGDWTYFIYLGLFMALAYIYLAWQNGRLVMPRLLWLNGTTIVATMAVFAPWLWGMIVAGFNNPEAYIRSHDSIVVDLAGLVLPDLFRFWKPSGLLEVINNSYATNAWESAAYLGLVNLGLLLVYRKRVRELSGKYLAGLAAFLSLALGTTVHLLGKPLYIPMPYIILQYVPFVANARAPSRIMVLVYLFLAIIIGLLLADLARKHRRSPAGLLGLGLIIALIGLDYYSICRDWTPTSVPQAYQVLPQRGTDYGLLDLPDSYRDRERYMMYQASHHIPIVSGTLPRIIGHHLMDRLDPNLDRPEEVIPLLRQNRVEYVVIHDYLVEPKDRAIMAEYRRRLKTVHQDEQVTILAVNP